ncbi:MAG: trypsin-like serine protease [Labilithrix sp.]|nr:trypsin-like serine protease [Labilithrix sp.]MCW5811096.1 trypsin-like serine protease [Labilithrix sp.]
MARSAFVVLAVLASVSTAACTAATEEAETAIDTNESDIQGGVDALNAEFDSIGQLAFRSNTASSNCTGALIAPDVVLTAKHCVMDKPTVEGSGYRMERGRVFFLLGPNARRPIAAIEVESVEVAPLFRGGYTGLGSDVALYRLKQAVPATIAKPLPIAPNPPRAEDLGAPFIAIGYGTQDAIGTSSTRKMGTVRLGAMTGAPAKAAFPTADAYVEAQKNMFGANPTPEQLAALRARYEVPLSDDYEVYVGAPATQGEVQVCHGDSGGPLLRRENGQLVIYGVASTTFGQTGRLCRDGGMYATFGAITRELLAKAIGDTCAPEGASTKLACGLDAEPATCAMLDGAGSAETSAYVQCLGNSCCSEATACFGDPECSALSNCFRDCAAAGTDAAATSECSNACYRARAGSYVKYTAYQTCARKSCATP